MTTPPDAIKNIHSAAFSAINKTTNEYAALSSEMNTREEYELDKYLFDSYRLFDDAPKDNPAENSLHTEEFIIYNKPFKPQYYTLTYLQSDESLPSQDNRSHYGSSGCCKIV